MTVSTYPNYEDPVPYTFVEGSSALEAALPAAAKKTEKIRSETFPEIQLTEKKGGDREKSKLGRFFFDAGKVIEVISIAMATCVKQALIRVVQLIVEIARTVFRCKEKKVCGQLVKANHPVSESQDAFTVNRSLMHEASKVAQTPEQKKTAAFLGENYLGKNAPTYMSIMRWLQPDVERSFQVTPHENFPYHRYGFLDNPEIGAKINQKFALSKTSPFIPTDTIEFKELYGLRFEVVDQSQPNLSESVLEHFKQYGSNPEQGLDKALKKPFLFDLTERLKDKIQTDGNSELEEEFKKEFQTIRAEVNDSIEKTVKEVSKYYPSISKKKLRNWLQGSCVCISRLIETETQVCGIKVLPVLTRFKKGRFIAKHPALAEFISNTGIFIGAVNFRRHLLSDSFEKNPVTYTPQGKADAVYFKSPKQITDSQLFKDLMQLLSSDDKPHMTVMGMATLNLVNGLLKEIEPQWESLNQDPFKREIFQTGFYKIMVLFAESRIGYSQNDFAAFAQNIELIHSELMNLLEITRPFNPEDYEGIYRDALQSFPIAPERVQIGLAKTGMNVFAGINAAIMQSTPEPVRAYGEGFYFEQAGFVGYDHSLKNVLADESVKKIDLYACQFNPNIEIGTDFTHYETGKVAEDIRRIFESKPETKCLTVAVDCTIDYINSDKVRDLLRKFQDEVTEANNGKKLNFVFFRSGQKLDQFGIDSYYGAPFLMVNDGSEDWQGFQKLKNGPAYQTDPLSLQWFCLSMKYAADQQDKYRSLIFNNSRQVIQGVPQRLKPAENLSAQSIRVNTIANDMDACFIDIKVTGKLHKIRANLLLARYYEKCREKGVKVHSRASFGFYHLNFIVISINEVSGSSTIRLTPGINPDENALIQEFLEELTE